MPFDRRSFLTTSAVVAVSAPAILRATRAGAAEYQLKLANNLPETHPLTVRMREAAAAIGKDTGGKVEMQVFPNNQLGSDTDMLSQLRSGALEFFSLSGLILSTLVPAASINGVGFAWSGYDKVWPAMDGELGAFVRAQIEKSGLYAFEKMWDNGFRQTTTSNKPIQSAADMSGMKIRVPVSPLSIAMFKGLGAAPASLQFSEVYSALQTRIVDAQENPLPIIQVAKLYEVQKYCSLTNHIWDGFWFIANGASWGRLPPDLQKVVAGAINDAGLKQREDIKKLNETVQADLAAKGLQFNAPKSDSFRAALREAGFYADWKKRFGDEAWGLLEQAVGKLA